MRTPCVERGAAVLFEKLAKSTSVRAALALCKTSELLKEAADASERRGVVLWEDAPCCMH